MQKNRRKRLLSDSRDRKMPDDEDEKTDNLPQKQREIEAKRLLARCKAVGRLWKGNFDVVEDIRQMLEERDKQIWQSK